MSLANGSKLGVFMRNRKRLCDAIAVFLVFYVEYEHMSPGPSAFLSSFRFVF
jgi:hypothetical protein